MAPIHEYYVHDTISQKLLLLVHLANVAAVLQQYNFNRNS